MSPTPPRLESVIFGFALAALLASGCGGRAPVSYSHGSHPPRPADHGELPQAANSWFLSARASVDQAAERAPVRRRARNVVLFVGDGMDVATVTAARILDGQMRGGGGEEGYLAWERFPHVAMIKTYSADAQVADSAGTATAIFSGVKTRSGVINVDDSVRRGDWHAAAAAQVVTLFELAEAAGLATGVVTTTRVTHATPAAVYGHTPDRAWEVDSRMAPAARSAACRDLALQLVEPAFGDGPEVVFGGGRSAFLPAGDERQGWRADGRDLLSEWSGRHPSGAVVTDRGSMFHAAYSGRGPVLGLFRRSHLSFASDRRRSAARAGEPSLVDMVRAAIGVLESSPHGYFLMVEAGRIDHAHHMGVAARALVETIELSRAVDAVAGAVDTEETLLLVTADHGHTMTIGGYPSRGRDILGLAATETDGEVRYYQTAEGRPFTTLSYANGPGAGERDVDAETWDDGYVQQALHSTTYPGAHGRSLSETHGGQDVPVWGVGPGAQLLQGTMEQHDLFHVVERATHLISRAKRSSSLVPKPGRGFACRQATAVVAPD